MRSSRRARISTRRETSAGHGKLAEMELVEKLGYIYFPWRAKGAGKACSGTAASAARNPAHLLPKKRVQERKHPLMNPQDYSRRLLLAVTGLSPQVVTETLYALAVRPERADSRYIPTEIRIITTEEGAQRARLSLLEGRAWFHKLCDEYQLPAITFDIDHIHILKDADNQQLNDIRSPEDNARAADEISEIVRTFTQDENSALHVSIAGGRKTMGFYLGYALSLYGRVQDRLSHVLVSSPYESHRDFFYPSSKSEVIHTPPPHNKPYDKHKARITLAEIPFVRMRRGLDPELLEGATSFSKAVAQAQRALPPLSLQLETASCTLTVGGEPLQLEPSLFAYYWMLAERARDGKDGVHWSDKGIQGQLLEYYAKLRKRNKFTAQYEQKEAAFERSSTESSASYFEQSKSRIRRKLQECLGKRLAEPYLIKALSTIPGSRYKRQGLDLPAAKIRVLDDKLPKSKKSW